MKMLTSKAVGRAKNFLLKEARPLEAALYRYHFEGGAADDVLGALAKFQNPDGGFGNGLEPDLRTTHSSVIATTVAFQTLRALNAPTDHPLVVSGMGYFRERYDADRQLWEIIPAAVEDAPHAPWWQIETREMFQPDNPRVEILGYLYDYEEHADMTMREALTAALAERIDGLDDVNMFDLHCYLRLYETEKLPAGFKAALESRLNGWMEKQVVTDSARWTEYVLMPVDVIEGPDDPFLGLFADAVDANLEYLIDNQTDDGSWKPVWSWGDAHPEAWAEAQREWSGVLTLKHLLTLRAFGRIEEEG